MAKPSFLNRCGPVTFARGNFAIALRFDNTPTSLSGELVGGQRPWKDAHAIIPPNKSVGFLAFNGVPQGIYTVLCVSRVGNVTSRNKIRIVVTTNGTLNIQVGPRPRPEPPGGTILTPLVSITGPENNTTTCGTDVLCQGAYEGGSLTVELRLSSGGNPIPADFGPQIVGDVWFASWAGLTDTVSYRLSATDGVSGPVNADFTIDNELC